MPEDPADDGRLLDERDETHAAATPGAPQHVKPEGAGHQRRPTLPAGLTPRRLGGIRLTSRLGGRRLQTCSCTTASWARDRPGGPRWFGARRVRSRDGGEGGRGFVPQERHRSRHGGGVGEDPRADADAEDFRVAAASGTERGGGAPRVERAQGVRGKRRVFEAIFPRTKEESCRKSGAYLYSHTGNIAPHRAVKDRICVTSCRIFASARARC
jgi:hypothetical protein